MNNGNDPVLRAERLTVGYAHRRHVTRMVIADVDLALAPGQLVALLGRNGSGKSTLLRTLAGMQRPLAGTVLIGSDDLFALPAREVARRVAVVLTDRIDAGLLSAYDLVALGRHPHTDWLGRLTREDHAVVRWALTATGSEDIAERPVTELSDGERQRVLIARAIAQEPAVVLLDEPTAFVDLPRRVELVGLLRRLTRESDLAVLVTTHDLDLALRSADRLWLIGEDGRVAAGAPEDLVLDGSLATTFHDDEVGFDPATGTFRATTRPVGTVRLTVTGRAPHVRAWTAHALERAGYAVAPDGLDGDVSWRTGEWSLLRDGESSTHATLGSLVDAVRRERAPARRHR